MQIALLCGVGTTYCDAGSTYCDAGSTYCDAGEMYHFDTPLVRGLFCRSCQI